MAFPTRTVLDTFDRANASTLGANWANNLIIAYAGATSDAAIASNLCTGLAGNYHGLHYTSTTYGPDCEAFLTLSTVLPLGDGDGHGLYLRIQQPGTSTYDGYLLSVVTAGSPNTWDILKVTDGVEVSVGGNVSQNIANGDKIGFEAIGSTLTGYLFTAGSWSQVIQRTDSTYAGAGLIGAYFTAGTTWAGDDFGGGTVRRAPMFRGS
jgi:hypothetical protein